MSNPRDAFLQRVRQAVAAGNRAGAAAALPSRGTTGYEGAGSDPVACFRTELIAAGGHAHLVPDRAAALARVLELVQGKQARRVLLGRGPFLDALDLSEPLRRLGLDVTAADTIPPDTARDDFFAADVGISGVDYLIAETGTVVLRARPDEPRSVSLLPPVHIAVAERSQLLPDLFDLFAALAPDAAAGALPSCVALITGPSKTGDIELRLVTGVHGPGEVHVVLVTS
jgi:L-lactate utilization protein LutC